MSPELLKTFAQTFFDTLGANVTSLEVVSGHRTRVAVTSPEGEQLIGQDGDTLRAINTLARRMVEHAHSTDAANFLIDINNFHEHQAEKVRAEARMLAQRVRLFKHDVDMEPMTAYDRLVVHELFADDPEVETHSDGEGKTRHIVLRYKQPVATA